MLRSLLIMLLLSAGPAAIAGEVIVRPATDGQRWSATYVFDQPVRILTFERPASRFRHRQWTVTGDDYQWEQRGDLEALVLRDGATPGARLEISFPVFTDHLEKEYELFRRFSDGGLLLYTGHLRADATPARAATPSDPAEPVAVDRFILAPRDGEHLVLDGGIHTAAVAWRDPSGQGTYAYFGTARPLASAHIISVLDPTLPDWLRDRFEALIPRLFAYYADRLGVDLEQRPTVFFSYDPAEIAGLESGGGVLPRLIQLSVRGRGWEAPSENALEGLAQFLAHEAAHLWNGDVHRYEGEEHSWMHEGSADAFAFRVLEGFEVIASERRWDKESDALNACIRGLRGGTSLAASAREGAFANYYSCGSVLASWTEARLRRSRPGLDLFDFWAALFAAAERRYDESDYYAQLRELGVGEEAVDALRDFVSTPQADPGKALADLMRGAGFAVDELADPPPPARLALAQAALRHLMAEDCGGNYSFDWGGDHFRTGAIPGCGMLADRRIESIAGISLVTDGHLAHDALADACETQARVRIGLTGGAGLEVACATPLAGRLPYLAIRPPG